jgi:putative colanic acid biosynthesis UDP-glucose lipid carrier transferase
MNKHLLQLKEIYDLPYLNNTGNKLSSIRDNDLQYVLHPAYSPLNKTYNVIIKRIADLLISMIVISVLLSWLLPIIALLIKIDSPGPVFFIQKRNKKNGKIFYCIKLRTMVVNEDANRLTAVINDKRITGFGRFLRTRHLDELPQFINVLIGDMSIIGPRPHMVLENIEFKEILPSYDNRHLVKPGITGLAQSFGYHGPTTNLRQLNKKNEYDLFYIRNWSPGMDIKILIRTISMIFNK